MADTNGTNETPIAQIGVMLLANGQVRIAMSPGLALDAAERYLYGALKFVEREIQTRRLHEMLDTPRVQLAAGTGLPRGPMIA